MVHKHLLQSNPRKIRHADVRIKYPGPAATKKLVVRLFDRKTWYYETNVITIRNDVVISVARNVRLIDLDRIRSAILHARCPDTTVDAVFGTVHYSASGGDPIATAKAGVDSAIASAVKYRGYKVKLLADKEATVENYINWASCSRVKAFGNIGHGNPNGIALYNGSLSSNWFDKLPDKFLSNKVIYFNSCQVHNNPLLNSVMSAGTRTYIGGIPNILIGASEEVFKCFWGRVLGGRTIGRLPFLVGPSMGTSLTSCEKNKYPTTGAHGLAGSSGPFWSNLVPFPRVPKLPKLPKLPLPPRAL